MKKFTCTGFDGLFRALTALVFAIAGSLALAQEASEPPPIDPELEKPPELAPLPPKIQDEQVKPTVTIREEEDRRVEEYSLNGKVYMVKITPDQGPPYYYIDTDGDGSLELDERSRALHPVQPVHWKIAEWK